MGLFGKSKEEKERSKIKRKVDKIMNAYDKEKIDKETFFENMMDLHHSYQRKKKK